MKNEKISEDTQHKSHVDRICLNVRSSKYYYNYGMSQYNVQNPNIKTRRIIQVEYRLTKYICSSNNTTLYY